MDNKFYKTAGFAAAAVFTAIILTPLTLLTFTGQDKAVLEGEKQYEAPAFKFADFASTEFQSNFENWFSTKYPLRSNFVTAYRNLQFDTSNMAFDITTLFLPKTPDVPDTPGKTDSPDNTNVPGTTTDDVTPSEPVFTYSNFNPLYAEINKRLYERKPVEASGYKGTDQVILGKNGYCYENGYINEQLGYSQKYAKCTDEWLNDRVEKLSYIQKRLDEMGIAFTLIFTPSKASEYEQYIPEWYKIQNSAPKDYIRPFTRILPLLDEAGLNYINCAALFDEIGLDETFPLTGIHWNKLAAVEATNALIRSYEEQKGVTAKKLNITNIIEQREPSGFGNPENDIWGVAYSAGIDSSKAVVDEWYYVPEVEIVDSDADRFNLLLQGGSFCWDFKHYFQVNKISSKFRQFYYNTYQGKDAENPDKMGDEVWEKLLDKIDYVVFECNEQMVCQMGCNAPRWAQADRMPADTDCYDVYESLYNYLKSTEN